MVLAEALEWAGPEEVFVSAMRLDVVANVGLGHDFDPQAHDAQWVDAELLVPDASPACRLIPCSPRHLGPGPVCIGLPLLLSALSSRGEGRRSLGHRASARCAIPAASAEVPVADDGADAVDETLHGWPPDCGVGQAGQSPQVGQNYSWDGGAINCICDFGRRSRAGRSCASKT